MKKPNEVFDAEIAHLNIIRLDNYINNASKIHFQCANSDCREIWTATPYQILHTKGSVCPKCRIYVAKYTDEMIDLKLKNYNIIRYGSVNDRTKTNKKIKFQCKVNNEHIFEKNVISVMRSDAKNKCPICYGKLKLSLSDIQKRFYKKNLKILSTEYKNIYSKLTVQCLNDNNVFELSYYNFFSCNTPCNICRTKIQEMNKQILNKKEIKKSLAHTNEYVDNKLKPLGIKRLDDYKNNVTKIQFQCEKCNYIWKTTPNILINKNHGVSPSKCPKCSNALPIDSKLFDEKIDLLGLKIKRLEECNTGKDKIFVQCEKCNYIWKTTPALILNYNVLCPKCDRYFKSEYKVKDIIEKNIKFDIIFHKKQLKFNNRTYYPDFFIIKNGKKYIIEYNGKQHYVPIRFDSMSADLANERFLKQQKRDEELRQYCKENNIFLLEIPYHWKEDVILYELKLFFNESETV